MTETTDIKQRALAYLDRFYGYKSFRPGQLEIITECMRGRDVTVLMPTGGGKSLCYQLPAIMQPGCAIVVSPLIALMHDQVAALVSNGIPAATINSSADTATNRQIMDELCAGRIKVLYISPERLLADLDWLASRVKISLIAIDEAHCISQWGHDFRPVYTSLSCLKERMSDVPVMALTATADRITRDDIVSQLGLRDPYNYIGSFDRPNISLTVMPAPSAARRIDMIGRLVDKYRLDSGIVYCLSRKTTESVYNALRARGYKAVCYHAGMSAQARQASQTAFINGDAQVVCATVAFGMGIDKSNIRWVVHYNMPGNIESYYQEVGRAGRDGLPAEALLFYSVQDLITLRNFAEESGQSAVAMEKLRRMQDFAEARICRRRVLLSYFNEDVREDCHNCDVCSNPPVRIDGTILAQKAMSAIMRTGQEVGMYMTVDILRASAKSDITAKGYHLIKTYGAGRDLSQAEWNYYMMQMLQLGLIEVDYNRGKKLHVTPYGREVLMGQQAIELTKYEQTGKQQGQRRKKAAPEVRKTPSLLDKLKELRRELAQKSGIPAYLIFSDATLQDMASKMPTTHDEFATVMGVGQKKLERFWQPFVAVIDEYRRSTLI